MAGHEVVPGEAIGPIRLEMDRTQVRELIGEPDLIKVDLIVPDPSDDCEVWEYSRLGLQVFFGAGENDVVESLDTTDETTTLHGKTFVGLTEAELKRREFGPLGFPVPVNDLVEFDPTVDLGQEYGWSPYCGFSFYVSSDGIVTSGTVI